MINFKYRDNCLKSLDELEQGYKGTYLYKTWLLYKGLYSNDLFYMRANGKISEEEMDRLILEHRKG